MKKRILSLFTALAVAAFALPTAMAAEEKAPKYQTTARQMERLNRGLIAVRTQDAPRNGISAGVYLSWRLLGDESLSDQAFDIYRDGVKIYTTGPHDATNYLDKNGNENNVYKVVKKGASVDQVNNEPGVKAFKEWNHTARGSLVGNGSEANSFSWVDIPIVRPANVKNHGGGTSNYYAGANDASVGDLDGDGDYEIVLKWDPSDSKDSASGGYTGNVYIDAYEISEDNGGYMWRIDLGKNIRAGAHYTQFMVYDLDGDGKSEVAMKTAPGSIDGTGRYVTEVGDSEAIRNADNNAVYLSGKGIPTSGGEFLTIFDGETGRALYTTDYISRDVGSWGDSNFNRSERYLAAVAYLNGETPSLIMCRGYYARAMVRAYNWDGEKLELVWEHNGSSKRDDSLYGQGNHNLSVADVDNDGRDEIVYGSAVLDDNGKAFANTYMGHGDAMHVSDFNNDGVQEVFSVKEGSGGYSRSEDFRVASTGKAIYSVKGSGDNGRGLMVNADDSYAVTHPNGLALGWSANFGESHDMTGANVGSRPGTNSRMMTNFAVYWDGDLGRELLDDNQLAKYHISDSGSWTGRFYNDGNGYLPASSINGSKQNPSLSVDLWGDWREEIIMPIGQSENEAPYLRIFTSTLPTEYRLTTLMHDSQYRLGIAWQNVAYNQPPHTSYYIGSAALAKDSNGKTLNYLAPETPFTSVRYSELIPVEGITLSAESVQVKERASYRITAEVYPENATRKAVNWISSDEGVATVAGGRITGVSAGTCTIIATTADGGFSAFCRVTVLPVQDVDVLGSVEFQGNGAGNTDFSLGVDSASVNQVNSTEGAEVRRDFMPFYKDTATISFYFNTGGKKNSNDAWNWDGREYSFGIQFLDTDGSNILTISQGYRSGAQSTQGTVNNYGAEGIKTTWTQLGSGSENPMDRSATTWHVTLEFNYDDDSCTATVMGSQHDIGYTKTFSLEGKSFKSLKYYTTVDGSGPITVGPNLTNLTYTLSTADGYPSITLLGVGESSARVQLIGSGEALLVGALYSSDGILAETKQLPVELSSIQEISFDKDVREYSLKLFMWDSLERLTPLAAPVSVGAIEQLSIETVSATDEPEPQNPAANACDGDLSTVWAAQGTQSITFDIGEPRLLTGVSVAFMKYDDDRTIPFRVYRSVDNENWSLVYSGSSVPGSGDFIDLATTSVGEARYVRLESDGNTVSGWTSLAEVKLYGSLIPAVEESPSPVVIPIKAVSATDEPQPENSAANACDGNMDTVWAAEGTQSITFDLGEAHMLTDVSLAFKKYEDERTIPFRVYLSSDNENWSLIHSGSSVPYSGGFIGVTVSPSQSARYVRIEADGNTVSGWTSLAEVLIYGLE